MIVSQCLRPLAYPLWKERARRHEELIRPLTEAVRKRRDRGEAHPVQDFLFTYYPFAPGKLLAWHPSFAEALEVGNSPALPPHFGGKLYLRDGNCLQLDTGQLRTKDFERLRFSHNLLRLTAARPASWSCYGLHEWAMVYRCENPRHAERAPLRLKPAEIADFVESQTISCSHFDAYRFFTPAALPRNRLRPTLLTREDHEQPGCVHANMDLYKWAFKAMPWIGSDLLRATFLLALELRELDMRASPYDLRNFGFEPIPIETSTGRGDYVREQQRLSNKAAPIRVELINALERLLTTAMPA